MMTMMAGAVVSPSLPQIAEVFKDVPNSGLLTRLVITLPAIFIAASSPLAGFLSDRIGRKNLLTYSLLLYAIGGTSGYYLDNIYLILVGRMVLGISVGGIMTLSIALIGDYFKGNERTAFMGLRGAFVGLGGVVFIIIAGWLADIQWQMPFLIYLFSIPVLILVYLYLYEPVNVDNTSGLEPDALPSYNRKMALIVYALAFITVVFFYMIPVQIPFILNNMEGISNSEIGYAISISTLTSAIVSLSYRRIKAHFHYRELYQIGFLIMAISYFIVSQSDTYGLVITGLALAGAGTGVLFPSGSLWIMEIAPEKIRGLLVGRVSMAVFLGMFLSPIILQPFINLYGTGISFLISSCSLFFFAMILFLVKKNRKV